MVIESLLNIEKTKKNPKNAFFIGLSYSIIGFFLALWVFPSRASLVAVFFTTMAAIPFITLVLKSEEVEDEKNLIKGKELFLKNHYDVLKIYTFLFLGLMFGFIILFTFLPQNLVNIGFLDQDQTINNIRTGFDTIFDNRATDLFLKIFLNNVKVLFFTVLFSLIYGTGAIFILTWNASVISVAIGQVIRTGLYSSQNLLPIILLTFLKYSIHGIPEIGAYFLGGIAGGILSTALIRNQFNKTYFSKIIKDVTKLVFLAIILLFVASFLEVNISPLVNI